ncbi:MAG: hypothetical protein P8Y94_13235 [Acidobacteriota bacterium]
MLTRVRTVALLGVLVLGVPFVAAKYKIKEFQVHAAGDYAAHQSFQNLVIGAYPCNTLEKTLELFDTDKLFEKGLMPVLIVVQNDGSFPVELDEDQIFLVDDSGQIAPGSTDHGVIFYRLPAGGNLEGHRLYLPEIVNRTNNARLMFFEFDLQ